MDTKKLRQKILDLAIRGKLVPQDPNDEPASVLLERIRAEKERLIAEGKIKRSRKSKTSSSESHYQNFEPPFEIPDSWEWVKLGEIGLWQSGATPSKSNPNYFGKGYPWLNTGDLNDGYISLIPKEITPFALKETSVKLNPAGSVLIAMYGATIGKLGILNIDATTNQACCACYKYWINQKYLFFFLLAWRPQFIQMGGGGAQPNISKEKIEETYIPCPPANEQLRIERQIEFIFELLNKVDVSKNDIEKTVVKTKSKILELALQGKLVPQDSADEPAADMLRRINPKAKIITDNPHSRNIPKNWVLTDLGSVCDFISGYAFKSENFKGTGIPIVRISNIQECSINMSSCVFYQDFYDEKFIINTGDLLVAMSGATTGKMGVYNDDRKALLNQRVGNIKTTPAIIGSYRNFYMYSMVSTILQNAYGGAQPNISGGELCELLVPLPPMDEQKRIVAKIEELFSVFDKIEASLQS